MAKSIGNLILKGASGQIGKQVVVRNRQGRVILSSYPIASKSKTDKQIAQREKFKDAVAYAKTVLAQADILKYYDAVAKSLNNGTSPFNIAVKDYLKPTVGYVDKGDYKGGVGNVIKIYTDSILPITAVSVKVMLNDVLLETSNAERLDTNEWVYTAQKANTDLKNTTIEISYVNTLGRKVVKTY